LVLETAALCDISVKSAVYKSSYLLTYLKVTYNDGELSYSAKDLNT